MNVSIDEGASSAELTVAAPPEDEWQALMATVSPECRFATAGWLDAWGKHFLPYNNWKPPLRYLTVRAANGRLQSVFPLAVQKRFGISIASLAGFYWPFRVPIIPGDANPETLEALASAFTRFRTGPLLRYGPSPAAHTGIASFNVALTKHGWRLHPFMVGETYSVDLPDTWRKFEGSLGRSLRTATYYYERKMHREGKLDIQCIRSSRDFSWDDTFRSLRSIEAASWQLSEGGVARFLGTSNEGFWNHVVNNARFAGMVSVWLMYFNGEPVSFCFCLDSGNVRHILANCYSESVHRYSTGSILYRYVFRDAIESGLIQSINIGLGDSGYKSRWGAKPSFPLVDWIAFRPGLLGDFLEFAFSIRQRTKAWKERIPRLRSDLASYDAARAV